MNPPRSLADDHGTSQPPPSPLSEWPPPPPPSASSSGIIAGTVIGSVVILLLALWMVFFIWSSKRSKLRSSMSDNNKDNLSLQPQPNTGHEQVGRWPQHNSHEIGPSKTAISSTIQSSSLNTTGLAESDRQYLVVAPLSSSPTAFTYEELEMATDGFSQANFLGQGGFGTVHKGVLPYTGQSVAIKQLRSGSKQGVREFQTEVQVISRVHHRHLVSLVGYCISEAHRTLMLVYEFVPNKTLDFHLHGKDTPTVDWATRMKIAIGSAKGLAYLHEDCQPKIIHRDIKAANILLDNDFEPKVADFGLARFSSDTETHVSTQVMGTFGYVAPEYAASGKLTEKSDVYSFGVMLLELITGRRPSYRTEYFTDDNMVDWAIPLLWEAMENRNFEELADERLENDYDIEGMFRMVSCAAHCIRHSAKRRPRMSQVVQALLGNICLEDLNDEQSMTPRSQYHKDSDKLSKREAFESLLGYNTSPYDYKHQFTSSSSGSKI